MRDINVDQIKKLWVLDLVIRSGSLKKASLVAKVSPSAISQTLNSLEKSVGRPLLLRLKGSVEPTAEAKAILDVVRPAFEAFDRLRDLSDVKAPQMAWLAVGAYESIAIDLLPQFIERIRNLSPKLRLDVRISRTANLLTMIRKGELCAALVAEEDNLERFQVRKIWEDRLGFYISAKQAAKRLSWDEALLTGVGSLAPGKNGHPRYYTKFLKQLGGVKPLFLSESFEVLRASAAAGAMVSILPTRIANRSEDLVEIFPEGSNPSKHGSHSIYLVSLPSCDVNEVDFLASEFKRIAHQH